MEHGGSVGSFAAAAEARFVTVLKCDIVGSTTHKRQLDLEGQLTFQRDYERIVAGTAARYGAHVQRFEGDGATVVLGFPQSSEDGAESGIRLGLDLVRAVGTADLGLGRRLQIRIGIASGPIAVPAGSVSPHQESIAGVTIDLAERLRVQAEPDQIIVADGTRALAGAFFDYEDLGQFGVKGFEEGVQAWRVLGPTAEQSRFDAQRFDPTRAGIIGREDEIKRMEARWQAALDGDGQAVILTGDPGIGKSRLARLARDRAVADGAIVFSIHCMPSASNTPLLPVGVFLRTTAGIAMGSTEPERAQRAETMLRRFLPADEIAANMPYLAPLLGLEGMPVAEGISPAELRDATIGVLDRMTHLIAAEQPLFVLCEDLHWADDTTATVLARLCENVSALRAMIVVTARPSTGAAWLDRSGAAPLPLTPLSRAEAASLVRLIAGHTFDDTAVGQIVDRCEGVPLLLEEVTRGAMDSTTGSVPTIPTSLQLVVQSRLTRQPSLAPIVKAASVLGREFPVRLLERMLSLPERGVAAALDLFVREGLLTRSNLAGDERARFKHVMICEAVYATLLGSDRQRLHAAAADLLLGDFADAPDSAADVVAEHLRKAKRFLAAIRIRLNESARTAARGAYVETEGHCVAAFDILEHIADPAERSALEFRLLIQLGVARTGRYGYSAAAVEDAYRRAHAVCGDSAEAGMLYPIMRGLATVNLVRGNLAAAYELSLQGLELAERAGSIPFRIDAKSVLCYTSFYYRSVEECRDWIERCLELYRTADGSSLTYPVPQDAATAAMALLPLVWWTMGEPERAEQAIQDGIAHVERLDRDFDRALLHSFIAAVRVTQRRLPLALHHAAIAIAISEPRGYREWHGTSALLAVLAQAWLQPAPESIAGANAACVAFASQGVGLNASFYLWVLAQACWTAGDAGTARTLIAEGFARGEASQDRRMHPELYLLQAALEADDAAMALLGQALQSAEANGDAVSALRAAAGLLLHAQPGQPGAERARAALNRLDGITDAPDEPGWIRRELAALKAAAKMSDHVVDQQIDRTAHPIPVAAVESDPR